MKKQSQARKGSNKTGASSQLETAAQPVRSSTDATPDYSERWTLILADSEQVVISATLRFSRSAYEQFVAAFKRFDGMQSLGSSCREGRNESPLRYFDYVMIALHRQAVRDLCESQPLRELECAVQQSMGALDLLADKVQTLMGNSSHELAANASCGVGGIASNAAKLLQSAWRDAHEFAVGRPV